MTPRWSTSFIAAAWLLTATGCSRQPEVGTDAGRGITTARQQQAVNRLTDRGIGLMGQFNFAEAAEAFAEARELDTDSETLRINHAIALLNTATATNLDKARQLLVDVLATTPRDPHAHFCLGIIALHRNELDEARPHFQAVTQIDPTDPSGWYHLGLTEPPGSAAATNCFEKALGLNANLTAAMHGLAMNLRRTDPKRATALLTGQQALLGAEWDEPLRIRYAEMGRYGNVIVPGLAVGNQLPPGRSTAALPAVMPSFANAEAVATLGQTASVAPIQAVADAHGRFGSIILPLVVDPGDSLSLLVLDRGQLALFERDASGTFRNTTAGHPGLSDLAETKTAIAAVVGDFDNDGRGDLAVTTATTSAAVRLLRNVPGRGFVDVSEAAGVTAASGPAIGAAWLDLDQDGDLDLVVARAVDGGGTAVLLNVSIAPAAAPNAAPPPLTPRFREELFAGLSSVPAAMVLTSDFDDDRDLDLLLLGGPVPQLVWNDRLLRFRAEPLVDAPATVPGLDAASLHAGLVLDVGADGLFERLLLQAEGPPLLEGPGRQMRLSSLPTLRQAGTADLDLDGRADLVGLTPPGSVAVAVGWSGRQWAMADLPVSADTLKAVCPADLDDDGVIDLLVLSESGELRWLRNTLSGRRAVRLVASGRRDRATSLRTNADGVGLRAVALAGPLLASCENTTLAAGLGQPRLPLHLGVGAAEQADVVRLVWPDGVPQAELDVPADRLVRIEETSRKTTSCPVLFAWNGQEFAFVTDFLGGGVTGETLPDGSIRPPRPHETVLIRPAPVPEASEGFQTVRLLITEPFDEVLYLDGLQLVVCDHPADWAVIADERFPAAGPPPTGDLLVGGPAVLPERAITESGEDVTELLSCSDGRMTAPPRPRSWLGYADRHAVELRFGSDVAKLPAKQPLVLELDGWTDYPYPESMWAAAQAGVALGPPILHRQVAGGISSAAIDVGFFAGLPRVMGLCVDRDFFSHQPAVFQLETSMQIGWDSVLVRPLLGRFAAGVGDQEPISHAGQKVTRHVLPLDSAMLRYAGLATESAVGDRGLVAYSAAVREPVPVSRWQGDFSAAGTVTETLRTIDREVVICGPGFDVECQFAADGLPPLAAGFHRSWFLEANGITRDTSPLTADAGRVQPVPAFGD